MSMSTIRVKVDAELARRVGTWFTVRDIQDKLKINPSTLKPLMMKYARESVLKRRPVKGTARSVEFSPAAHSPMAFQSLVLDAMPYRSAITVKEAVRAAEMKTVARKRAANARRTTAKSRTSKR